MTPCAGCGYHYERTVRIYPQGTTPFIELCRACEDAYDKAEAAQ